MSGRAHVSSLESLEQFRARMLVFRSEALTTVGEVLEEVRRTRLWLQNDMVQYWRGQVRRREAAVSEARQRQFGSELVGTRSGPYRQETRRAQAALKRAEEKLRRVKSWSRRFDEDVQPLCLPLEKLEYLLSTELMTAAAELSGRIQLLQAYAETAAAPPVDKTEEEEA